jgi:hypothetical protein
MSLSPPGIDAMLGSEQGEDLIAYAHKYYGKMTQ